MSTTGADLEAIVQAVNLDRRKGDALSERQQSDRARDHYEQALDRLDGALARADGAGMTASDRSELLGMRGGVLRRLGRTGEALESYRAGAVVERDGSLPGTYNRGNAIKLALISGASTLADVQPDLAELGRSIEATMRADVQAASNAWNHADLGDAMLLTGRVVEAADAYRTFSSGARSDSPAKTLTVLREIAGALRERGDPDEPALRANVDRVERMLTGR